MTIEDVIQKFSNYANVWSEQQGGGPSDISLTLPGYEQLGVTYTPAITTYKEMSGQSTKDVALCSQTFTNTSNAPQNEFIVLSGGLERWGSWQFTRGASFTGRGIFNIDKPSRPAFLNVDSDTEVPLKPGETVKITATSSWDVNHPFMVKPRFQVTATLMVNQLQTTQPFEVEIDLSGYLGVITKNPINDNNISLHHVARILQRSYSPYIQVDGRQVKILHCGEFKAQYGTGRYIHIKAQSLDFPNLVEEFNIYPPLEGSQGITLPINCGC